MKRTGAAARESLRRYHPGGLTLPALHACGSASPFRAYCCHKKQNLVEQSALGYIHFQTSFPNQIHRAGASKAKYRYIHAHKQSRTASLPALTRPSQQLAFENTKRKSVLTYKAKQAVSTSKHSWSSSDGKLQYVISH